MSVCCLLVLLSVFWIRNWSHIVTHLAVVLVLVEATFSKKAWGSGVSNQIGATFDGTVFQVNTHRLTKSNFWYDVILARWRLRRLLAARCCLINSDRRLPASPPSKCDVIGSPQFLIHSTLNLFHSVVYAVNNNSQTQHLESRLDVIQGHVFWDHWKADEKLRITM